jgi:uncharacterized protein YbjT (DUF2867 family)
MEALMADKKTIAVIGATGAQGGGLVRAILNDPAGGFSARAITRNAGSEKAQALAQAGAQVMTADLDDEASIAKTFKIHMVLSASQTSGNTFHPQSAHKSRPRATYH